MFDGCISYKVEHMSGVSILAAASGWTGLLYMRGRLLRYIRARFSSEREHGRADTWLHSQIDRQTRMYRIERQSG